MLTACDDRGYKMMGFLPGFVLRRVNAVEYDLAGVIVDANGSEFKEGDEVYGWISFGGSSSVVCILQLTLTSHPYLAYPHIQN